MTRSRIVIGLVSIPVLAAGLTAWLSMGDVEAVGQIAQHPACDPAKTGCPAGVCCGDFTSQTSGGCSTEQCCPGSETYCSGHERVPSDFPSVRIDGSGFCLVAAPNEVTYCRHFECEGSLLCPVGDCTASVELHYVTKGHPPVEGAPCLIAQQ